MNVNHFLFQIFKFQIVCSSYYKVKATATCNYSVVHNTEWVEISLHKLL